jgi:hypothetical protein
MPPTFENSFATAIDMLASTYGADMSAVGGIGFGVGASDYWRRRHWRFDLLLPWWLVARVAAYARCQRRTPSGCSTAPVASGESVRRATWSSRLRFGLPGWGGGAGARGREW